MKKWFFLSILFCQSALADCYGAGSCITPPGSLTIVYDGMSGYTNQICPLDYFQLIRGSGTVYVLIQGCMTSWYLDMVRQVVTFRQDGNNVYIRYTDFGSPLAWDAIFIADFE